MTAAAPGTRFRTQGGHHSTGRRNDRARAAKTIAARYGLGKDELEGNKEALMRRVNYKQHASKASRIFQSGPAWVG